MAGVDAVFWDELFAGLAAVEDAAEGHWIERVLVDDEARAALAGRVMELGCRLGSAGAASAERTALRPPQAYVGRGGAS